MREFRKGETDHYDLDFGSYRKMILTRAARVKGPFTVETSEGPLACQDGWLALDASGNFYPIADEVFQATYELAKEEMDAT